MGKILSTKFSAIFLAIVLVTGMIALSFPSFMTTGAQAQPYYGRENRYNSYEPDYRMDNERKSYENDNYESQYPSYDKDNNSYHKSKDAGIIGLRAPPGIEICFDRIDNDSDGLRDFADPDCQSV